MRNLLCGIDHAEVIAKRKALCENGDILLPEEMAEKMSLTVAALNELEADGLLFSMEVEGIRYFPWYFSCPQVSRNELKLVCKKLGNIDAWEKYIFFVRPVGSLGGMTPLQGLRQSKFKEVLRAAAAFADA